MLHFFNYIFRYIIYFFKARYYYGHGVHSPFMYRFVRKVLFVHNRKKFYKQIDRVFNEYKRNHTVINLNDFGAGSRVSTVKTRQVSDIVRNSSTRKKYGKLLSRMVEYFKVKHAVELGTSLGIGSLYIAGNKQVELHTIEGDKSLYEMAKSTFEHLKLDNIYAYFGTFDKVLPIVLEKIPRLDMVYFDGNHTKEATLKYFEICLQKIHNETIFVFDDIYWSEDMEAAWEEIKENPKVKVSVDIFQMGIVFFRKELSKEHYIIRY